MTGVIWLVQLLLYPFFKSVGKTEFLTLHQFHLKQITWIVAPVMLTELITAIWLFISNNNQLFFWNLMSVVILWLITIIINVPTHNNLTFDSEISKTNLILRNWPRTIVWSLRSVILSFGIWSQVL
jgi:hypothetical protein